MDSEQGEKSTVITAGTSSLSEEVRQRIEKNKQEARKRLQEKSEIVQEVLAAYQIFTELEKDEAVASAPPPKKFKSAAEEKFDRDLQNVVSKGTVVRIQGTKLVDTGGGFLLEEQDLTCPEDETINLVKEPAAIAPTDVPTCVECNKTFVKSFLLTSYDHPVCDSCKDVDEKHSFITRTDAKNEYLLKDVDFDKREPPLRFLLRPNPHNPRWGDMKLYLRLQVEKRAVEVWGSFEEIGKQQNDREENRVKSKVKKFQKKMKTLRMSARSSLYTRDLSGHEHSWGVESYDDDEDMYSHTCTLCGQVESYEKM